MTGRKTVAPANGRELSALQIQREYLERAQAFADREGLEDPIHKQVLDLWERTLTRDRDRQPRPGRHRDRLGHQAQAHRPATRPSTACPMEHPRIAQLDLAYHDINRQRGLFYLLQKHGRATRITTDPEVFEAKTAATADDPGQAARGLHPRRAGAPPRLHRGLGAPEAERPGPADGPVQGPVRGGRRPRGAADRGHARLTARDAAGLRGRGTTAAAGYGGRWFPRPPKDLPSCLLQTLSAPSPLCCPGGRPRAQRLRWLRHQGASRRPLRPDHGHRRHATRTAPTVTSSPSPSR